MDQKIKRLGYYSSYFDSEVENILKDGYVIKQISGTGDYHYVWVLFEKYDNINTL